MSHVSDEVIEPREASLIAEPFHRLRNPAYSNGGLPLGAADASGTPGWVSASAFVLGGELDVESQLLLEVAIGPLRP
ncbi:MAG TPA: hypothetical protein VNZ26_01955 [Vicinamibacterales bacterium]|nr:hypothetical protein [Vicinamibacterales bacterium]